MPVSDPVKIGTFRKICALARDHNLLLIAGDLFHRHAISKRELELVAGEFSLLREKEVEIFYTPGEKDYGDGGALPGWLEQSNLTHAFTAREPDEPRVYEHTSGKIYIYGMPAGAGGDGVPRRVEAPGFHMGLFHAEFVPENGPEESGLCTMTKRNLNLMILDLYALGHRHNFKIFKSGNRIIAAYPGSPEAVTHDETGDRYALSIMIDNDEIQQIKRLAVNTLRVSTITILCDETDSLSRLADMLEKEKSPATALTLTLRGRRSFPMAAGALDGHAGDFHSLTVVDESHPTLETLAEEFSGENSLRGEFYGFLRERLEREGLPDTVDRDTLEKILNSITRHGRYEPEEWAC